MGGGINLELLARLQLLENEVSGLRQELTQVKQSRGGEDYGLVKLTSSSTVTDSTGLALPTSENNATVEGTLANRIAKERLYVDNPNFRWGFLKPDTINYDIVSDVYGSCCSIGKIAFINFDCYFKNMDHYKEYHIGEFFYKILETVSIITITNSKDAVLLNAWKGGEFVLNTNECSQAFNVRCLLTVPIE